MTAERFRELVLELPAVQESAHMGHPDFRVGGKIFATLWPEKDHGVVRLAADEQAALVGARPQVFAPMNGSWGRQGWTRVALPKAGDAVVRDALVAAWRGRAPKRLLPLLDGET